LLAVIALSIIPFVFSGLFLSLLYWSRPEQISGLYAFDLGGAAAGCASAIWLLDRFGAAGVPWLAAALLVAAAVLADSSRRRSHMATCVAVLAILAGGWA